MLDCKPKLVAIDEETNHQIVHGRRFGKADRAAHQTLTPTAPLMSCRQSLSALRSSGASHSRKEPEGCYRFAALQMMCTPFHRLK